MLGKCTLSRQPPQTNIRSKYVFLGLGRRVLSALLFPLPRTDVRCNCSLFVMHLRYLGSWSKAHNILHGEIIIIWFITNHLIYQSWNSPSLLLPERPSPLVLRVSPPCAPWASVRSVVNDLLICVCLDKSSEDLADLADLGRMFNWLRSTISLGS